MRGQSLNQHVLIGINSRAPSTPLIIKSLKIIYEASPFGQRFSFVNDLHESLEVVAFRDGEQKAESKS